MKTLVKLGEWELVDSQWGAGSGASIYHMRCPTYSLEHGWDTRQVRAVGAEARTDKDKCWYCNRLVPDEMVALFVFYNK